MTAAPDQNPDKMIDVTSTATEQQRPRPQYSVYRLSMRRGARCLRQSATKIGAVLLVLVWAGVFLKYQDTLSNDLKTAIQLGENYSRVFEENALRTIGEVDQTLLYFRRDIEAGLRSKKGYPDLVAADVLSELVLQLAIIDGRGMLRASSVASGPVKPIDLSDRPHFRVHANKHGDTLHVSAPVLGRATNKWSIQLTRRLHNDDGSFAGVVVASLNPGHLTSFYQSIDLGPSVSLSMVGLDGRVRAESGGAGKNRFELNQDISQNALLQHAREDMAGHFFETDSNGKQSHLVSFRRLRGHPLVVSMSVSTEQIRADARQELLRNGIAGVLASLLVVMGSFWAARHQIRLRAAQLRLSRTQRSAIQKSQALQLTLDNMGQGIVSVDRTGKVQFINQNAARMLELPLESTSGQLEYKHIVEALQAGAGTNSDWMVKLPSFDNRGSEASCSESYESARTNGTTLEVQTTLLDGGGFVHTLTDVTRRNQARAAIARLSSEASRERERLELAVNNMPIGLVMFDAAKQLIVCNDRYREMYQLSEDETRRGQHLRQILESRASKGCIEATSKQIYLAKILDLADTKKDYARTAELQDGRFISVRHKPVASGGWIATHEDITERRRAEREVEHLARHDQLTGIANRATLSAELEKRAATAEQDPFAVLLLDLDHFKSVNDTLGHPIGDKLLKQVGDRLVATARGYDIVARLGGDEFAIIECNIASDAAAAALSKRLLAALTKPYIIDGHHIVIGASIGIALAPEHGTTAEKLLQAADIALYQSKANGRNTYRTFTKSMMEEVQERRDLESELRDAIEKEQLEVHYQPIVSAKTLDVEGYEALIRWRHPVRGMISPGVFIPIAESSGLIVAIGNWMLRKACAQIAACRGEPYLSVNVSPLEFKEPNIAELFAEAIEISGLPGGRLQIEVTEGVLLTADKNTLDRLQKLRQMGIRVSMDDFGTGYSSLSYLRKFPFDKIKIDRSLIKDIAASERNKAIVRAVVNLANSLGMITTAEGIENAEELAGVRDVGCDEVQGYLIGRPMPASAAFLQRIAA